MTHEQHVESQFEWNESLTLNYHGGCELSVYEPVVPSNAVEKQFECNESLTLNDHGGCELSKVSAYYPVIPSNAVECDISYCDEFDISRLRQTHVIDVILDKHDKTYKPLGLYSCQLALFN